MEWTNILNESMTVGNFVDENTFLDDDGNPIPLIKSDFSVDLGDDEDSEMSDKKGGMSDKADTFSDSENGLDDTDDEAQPNSGKSSNSDRNKSTSNQKSNSKNSDSDSNDSESEDSDGNDSEWGDTDSSSNGESSDSNEDGSDGESNEKDDNPSDQSNQQNSGKGKGKNQTQDQKPDPSVFDNPPKVIDMDGAETSDEDGIRYDMEDKPLIYGTPKDGGDNKKDTNQQSQKKKIAPNPNKIYVDTKTGKSYKFDYNQNKFVQVYMGNGN